MSDVLIRPERPDDEAAIAALISAAFGPGAYARAAFRVREQAPHDRTLSFVAERDGRPIASVRLTPIRVGEGAQRGQLLGPLVVDPAFKGQGHGRRLVRHALEAARRAGEDFVMLVGDAPYYARFGFSAEPTKELRLPGPYERERFLGLELQPGALKGARGLVGATGERNDEPDWTGRVAASVNGAPPTLREAA